MPFFPRFHYPESTMRSSYAGFPTDILRMFDEFDHAVSSSTRRAFSPNFDIHETEHEYVLEGEFPGISDKKNISIEFTDDNTILVHGKTERSTHGWKDSSQGNVKQATIEAPEEKKAIEGTDSTQKSEKKEKEKKEPKYWVTERSVGEFSRSFRFPGDVDVDKVKASLEHGILKVVVPKMEKRTGRKIDIL
ncbi:30 kDa heat shock protein [Pyronema omphalodes]|nr:30 kDa heat shock protein [Pyronema omphalodes]